MLRRLSGRVNALWRHGAATMVGACVLLSIGAGAAFGAFTTSTANPANSFSAAADWVAPQASASVIAKSAGGIPSYVKQGGTYHVYANVTDSGNPASGTQTVTADVSSVTSGQTAAALTSGSFSIGGVSYNYRSAQLTASNPLTAGSKSYTLALTDAASNARTQTGFSVTVDNTTPTAADIQAVNGSGTANKPDLGDLVTFTYSEQMEPISILAGWSGSSTNVVVRIDDGGGLGLTPDVLKVYNAANSAQLPIGSVDLGSGAYVSANRTFGASGTPSTMSQSGGDIIVTLGTPSGSTGTPLLGSGMTWTPSSTATDRAANAASTAPVSEPGLLDWDF